MFPRLLGRGLVAAGLALTSATGCRTAGPAPSAPAATQVAADLATPTTTPIEAPPLDEAAKSAKLDESCGDPARFGDVAFALARGPDRDALVRIRARPKTGAAPLAPEDRRRVEDLVRQYLARCGLKDTIELTTELVALPTVSAREPAATGEAFRAMAEHLAAWAKAAGLELRISGANDAWELGFGAGEPSVGFLMHADVVPIDDGVEPPKDHAKDHAKATAPKDSAAANARDALTGEPLPAGWTKPPFRATLEGDKLYGRGTEDDKGPIAAVLVAMRAMAKLGLEPHGRVLAMLGTGEEHDWEGMKRYAASLAKKPTYVISVDSGFPVIVAESGFVAWGLAAPVAPAVKDTRGKCAEVVDAKGGQFLTQVPGEASLTLRAGKADTLERLVARAKTAAAAAEKELGAGFRVEVRPRASEVEVHAFGEAIHSSTADEGKNALWALAKAADRLDLCPGGVRTMLMAVSRVFAGDHWGTRLELAYEHPVMGRLLVAATVLRVEGAEVKLEVNMRRPAGMDSAAFGKKLDLAVDLLKKYADASIHASGERYVGEPALADTTSRLVPTLLELYREHAKAPDAKVISSRGGTYARLFPGAVSFGPSLPGRPYRGHAPDEYVELDALKLLNATLFEAILRLDAPEPTPAPAKP